MALLNEKVFFNELSLEECEEDNSQESCEDGIEGDGDLEEVNIHFILFPSKFVAVYLFLLTWTQLTCIIDVIQNEFVGETIEALIQSYLHILSKM